MLCQRFLLALCLKDFENGLPSFAGTDFLGR